MTAPVEQTQIGMPMEDFIRLYDEAPFELIDGERRPLMPNVLGHSALLEGLHEALVLHKQATRSIVIHTQSPYVLTYSPNWVKGSRVPDIMVYRAERMAAYQAQDPEWESKPAVLVPDVCIEIVSPNDIYDDIDEKVERYLSDGVQMIWVVGARAHTVKVHRPGGAHILRLTVTDTLDGGDVLPGFALALKDLFG